MKRIQLVLAALLLGSLASAQETKLQVVDKVVAVVGKNIILQSDVEGQYIQYRMQGDIQGNANDMRCAILEDLLFQKLMLNQAEMDSLTVTDNEVEMEMNRRISELVGRAGSQEKLESIFNKSMSEIKEELRRLVKDRMLQDQVRNGILSGVAVTPAEVRKAEISERVLLLRANSFMSR